ncbi:MAG TPA: ATP-binding cassette domain-containing protein [Bacteroidia bacterium]|jgi:putative ABC transport system ATP-binding protein|nr:ATP-binding cassette domain-containing protein [Bacteroidia bacterium]
MIELQQISKIFNKGKVNEVVALNNISLTIKEEEFIVVLGANGSGKTTLLNIISGTEFSSQGKVIISETDVSRLPEYKRSKWIARVFQNPLSGTASDLSILDNFRLASIRTTKKKLTIGVNDAFRNRVRDRIAELGMGLENKLEQAMGTLSGGQRQALTLLMSVMDDSKILLLDEPTAALDPRSAAIILQTADKLIKRYKLTAVLITHNLKEAHQYGNRLIKMSEGEIQKDLSGNEKNVIQLQDLYAWFSG